MGEFVLEKKGQEHLIYDLFGVVNHYGSLNFGHYKAVALCENKWIEYDDSSTRVVQEEDVVTEAAYIYFFKRRGFGEEEEFDYTQIRQELPEEM